MKKLLTIAVLATISTLANADSIWGKHSDGYLKKKEGIEPYASHFSGAEIDCLGEGYSWPGFLTGEKAAQLQTSEMVLCIETNINKRVAMQSEQDKELNNRLLEIEEALQKLMLERDKILNG